MINLSWKNLWKKSKAIISGIEKETVSNQPHLIQTEQSEVPTWIITPSHFMPSFHEKYNYSIKLALMPRLWERIIYTHTHDKFCQVILECFRWLNSQGLTVTTSEPSVRCNPFCNTNLSFKFDTKTNSYTNSMSFH